MSENLVVLEVLLSALRHDSKDILLSLHVTPKASRTALKIYQAEDGSFLLKVFVTTVPEDGKANAAVLEFLAKAIGKPLRLSKSCFEIVQGAQSRHKVLRVTRP